MLALLTLVREPVRQRSAAQVSDADAGFADTLRSLAVVRPALVPLILGCALMAVGDSAMLGWVPALLARRYHLAASEIGFALGIPIIASGALASFGGGAISDRMARRSGPSGRLAIAAVSAAIALPFAFIGLTTSASQVIVAVTAWSLFSTCAGIVGMTASQEIVPNRARGLSVSFIAFGNIMLGLGGGTTLTGYVTDHVFGDPLSVGRSLTMVIVPAGIAAIVLFFVASRAARSLTP